MKTVKSRAILLVITIMLVLSMTVGLTLAYFSDHKEAKGGSMLVLGGEDKIHEEVGENSKSVWIENTGETRIVVRVAIYGPSGMKITANESNWYKDEDGFYYYKGILDPGQLTPQGTLKAEVTLPKDKDLGDEYQIVVVQECAQVIYADDGSTILKPDGWAYVPTEA